MFEYEGVRLYNIMILSHPYAFGLGNNDFPNIRQIICTDITKKNSVKNL